MLAATIEIIRSILKADATVSPSDRARMVALIKGSGNTPRANPNASEVPRLIRRAEAARRLSCSLRLIDRLAAQGFLKKQTLPGRARAAGFLESDIALLIAGRAQDESPQTPAKLAPN